jgi:hypothetical protein
MCPACISTAAWLAAGATSTGGITAMVIKMVRGRTRDAGNGVNPPPGSHSTEAFRISRKNTGHA